MEHEPEKDTEHYSWRIYTCLANDTKPEEVCCQMGISLCAYEFIDIEEICAKRWKPKCPNKFWVQSSRYFGFA